MSGSLADFVSKLRQQDGGTIGVAGSPSIVQSLIEARLLDELTLMISPVVPGGGRARLFPATACRSRCTSAGRHGQPSFGQSTKRVGRIANSSSRPITTIGR